MLVALFTPNFPDAGNLAADLLSIAPRITVGADVIWADARGLNAHDVALMALSRAVASGAVDVRAGVARVPVAAELAARMGAPETVTVVDGDAAAFIAPFPLTLFAGHERLLLLLEGVGVQTCGELAALDREAVEVRFGAEAVELWQLARGHDERRIFTTTAPDRLHASTDFIDYVVTDPERLIFVANSLFATLCDRLRARGEHARRVLLTLSLANRTTWQRTIRPARPTASRVVWLRLTRALLERITVADAVTGVQIEVLATEAATAVQGDLFDPGFATAAAVENAVARLVELQGHVIMQPARNQDARIEKRNQWAASTTTDEHTSLRAYELANDESAPEMHLRLLDEPREVLVETIARRDHVIPVRFHDREWHQLITCAGPDRISGGRWEEAYAREYYRAVTVAGDMVWLYRDGRTDMWYVQGGWD